MLALDNWVCGKGLAAVNDNEVRVLDTAGARSDWLAYAAGQWGTNVTSGDLDGDGRDDAITGPGPGPVYGPQVKGFRPSGAAIAKVNFYAYGTLKYGVNVAGANMDADRFGEMITAPGRDRSSRRRRAAGTSTIPRSRRSRTSTSTRSRSSSTAAA
ncbi:MAG: hypothetical protein U0166_23880 [Acidobacteriota bacterium]